MNTMFSGRIIDLVCNGTEKKYSISHLSQHLSKYHDEFFNETKTQYNNKNLRKYVNKMVGYGLISQKDGEINLYLYDENTVTEEDLKYATQLNFNRYYPDDFDELND